jgi:hypothetical protein
MECGFCWMVPAFLKEEVGWPNIYPKTVSQLRPTAAERSSGWTIARFIFLCRVARVCPVPWARTCLSSGLNKKVGRRHASSTVSILAVLLCAAALTGIANGCKSPHKVSLS